MRKFLAARLLLLTLLSGLMPAAFGSPAQACPRVGAVATTAHMPVLARQLLNAYARNTPATDPAITFRLQLIAGDYASALTSIEETRRQRGAGSDWLFLQYELHARAHMRQAAQHLTYADAWRAEFQQRFGALDDATAMQAEFGFGADVARMRSDADAALAAVHGQPCLALPVALELLRKVQVHAAYAAFVPLFAPALAEDDARRYSIDRNASVRTTDGATLAALVIRPRTAAPLPTLLQFTIYANDDWAWADAKKMASRGYASVVAYARGKGRSNDAIVPYLHDGADAATVVDWIAAQPWSDGRVGMYGGSYSGFTQWAALKHTPKALKAIATSATTAPGIDVPMEGGVFLNFLYPWPVYVASNRHLNDADYGNSTRWNNLNRNGYASGRAYRDLPSIDGRPNPIFSEWLQHPAYDAYWQALTPQGEEFAGIDIPVLVTTGYFDGAQIGALHYFRQHLRARPEADHSLLIGPFEHFSMQTGVPPMVQGYAVDPSARIDLQALRLDWFDHVFKGAAKPALLADRVNWQVMGSDQWRHAHTLAEMATRTQRYYLTPTDEAGFHLLAAQPQPAAITTQRVDFTDRSDASWQASANVVNPSIDAHAGLVFATPPLPHATEFAGDFTGLLEFRINKRDVDVSIGVAERMADGRVLDLAFWIQRASYNRDPRHRRLLPVGQAQQLRVQDTRLLGRTLAAGSRLIVTVGVIKQPDHQLNLGSGKEPADETLADAAEPLVIQWLGSSWLAFGLRD